MPNVDQWKGSRLRCLLMTGMPGVEFASLLTWLAQPSGAIVTPDDTWYPRGICHSEEAELVKPGFNLGLNPGQIALLKTWWLGTGDGRTPCWDVAASALFANNKKGLVLVEAKAHTSELGASIACGATGNSRTIIDSAITGANTALGIGYALSTSHHYQISNRIAWAWKLASMGVPVVLIYLGFLNTCEMGDDRFATHTEWVKALHDYAAPIVPCSVWGTEIAISGGATILPLIRSLDIQPQAFIRS
jgi:hypothetical protein